MKPESTQARGIQRENIQSYALILVCRRDGAGAEPIIEAANDTLRLSEIINVVAIHTCSWVLPRGGAQDIPHRYIVSAMLGRLQRDVSQILVVQR